MSFVFTTVVFIKKDVLTEWEHSLYISNRMSLNSIRLGTGHAEQNIFKFWEFNGNALDLRVQIYWTHWQ